MSLRERKPLTYWSLVAFGCAIPYYFLLALNSGATIPGLAVGMLCGTLTWVLIIGCLTASNRWSEWKHTKLALYFYRAATLRASCSFLVLLLLRLKIDIVELLGKVMWIFLPDMYAGALAISLVVDRELGIPINIPFLEIYLVTVLMGIGVFLSTLVLALIMWTFVWLIAKSVETLDRVYRYIGEAYPK